MKTKLFLMLALLPVPFLTNCAHKGAATVYTPPLVIPQKHSPTNWAVQDAPRTQPGKIMDPQAVTYAQVPSRIIYQPGENGIFSRSSAQQDIAYDLVPVDRIPEVQAQGTPEYNERSTKGFQPTAAGSVTMMTIAAGNHLRKGKARRLGIMRKSEKSKAENLLAAQESLEWDSEIGWVGFLQTQFIDLVKDIPKTKLPEIDTPKVTPPTLEAPDNKPNPIQDPPKTTPKDPGKKPELEMPDLE